MKCEHCGAHIEETDKRCPYCNSYNEQYKKPQPPAQPQQRPQVNNTANKKPEEPQGAGCFTVFSIIFLVILFFIILKNCATSSTKKGYTDSVVEKHIESINENLNFSDTNENGLFFQTSGKFPAPIN